MMQKPAEILLVPTMEIRREKKVVNSRFIAILSPASSIDDARNFITKISKEFPDANHHVNAFIIGHGRTRTSHCSDDSEPSGSAGRPTLAVLEGSGLGDVVVVISRYFGGTKLGVGGLVRAYGDLARMVVNEVPRSSKVMAYSLKVVYPYAHVERMRKLVSEHSGLVIDEKFEIDVTMNFNLPIQRFEHVQKILTEETSGKSKVEVLGKIEMLVPIA